MGSDGRPGAKWVKMKRNGKLQNTELFKQYNMEMSFFWNSKKVVKRQCHCNLEFHIVHLLEPAPQIQIATARLQITWNVYFGQSTQTLPCGKILGVHVCVCLCRLAHGPTKHREEKVYNLFKKKKKKKEEEKVMKGKTAPRFPTGAGLGIPQPPFGGSKSGSRHKTLKCLRNTEPKWPGASQVGYWRSRRVGA